METFLALFGSVCTCVVACLFVGSIAKDDNIRPHPFTWAVWSFIGVVGVSIAVAQMGMVLSLLPLTLMTCAGLIVFAISLTRRSDEELEIPKALPLMVVLGIAGWVIFKDPLLAAICVVVADFVAGIPTLVKMWRDPASEAAWWIWGLDSVGLTASLFSDDFTLAASLYPMYIICAASTLSVFALLRRNKVPQTEY